MICVVGGAAGFEVCDSANGLFGVVLAAFRRLQ